MTWNIINSETGKSCNRNSDYSLAIGDKILNSDTQVATAFENFFADIPVSTTKSLNSSAAAAESLLRENVSVCDSEFNFQYVTCKDIIKTFYTLNVKKTADLWGHSVDVAKSKYIKEETDWLIYQRTAQTAGSTDSKFGK